MRWCVENDGFALIERVFEPIECQQLISLLGPVDGPGRRRLLAQPEIAALARSTKLSSLLGPYAGPTPRPVRAIYFDKTADANWSVPWHQDLLIAVRERIDVPGFGPWSVKAGIPHVQPPTALLERMLTLRLHLDATNDENGALSVLSGSHRSGLLSSEAIDELCGANPAVLCSVPAGGVLLMRPLLLHSSRRSSGDRHRRVLHLEYAGFDLPGGLEWSAES